MPLDPDDWAVGAQDRDYNTEASLVITIIAIVVGLLVFLALVGMLILGT